MAQLHRQHQDREEKTPDELLTPEAAAAREQQYVADYQSIFRQFPESLGKHLDVIYSAEEGKYLVANEDLDSGFYFLNEVPLVRWGDEVHELGIPEDPRTELGAEPATARRPEALALEGDAEEQGPPAKRRRADGGRPCCQEAGGGDAEESDDSSPLVRYPNLPWRSFVAWQQKVSANQQVGLVALAKALCHIADAGLAAGAAHEEAREAAGNQDGEGEGPAAATPTALAPAERTSKRAAFDLGHALRPWERFCGVPKPQGKLIFHNTTIEEMWGLLKAHRYAAPFCHLPDVCWTVEFLESLAERLAQNTIIYDPERNIKGIFVILSLMNHSCEPNVEVVLERLAEPEGDDEFSPYSVRLITSRPVSKGERLTISYCPNITDLDHLCGDLLAKQLEAKEDHLRGDLLAKQLEVRRENSEKPEAEVTEKETPGGTMTTAMATPVVDEAGAAEEAAADERPARDFLESSLTLLKTSLEKRAEKLAHWFFVCKCSRCERERLLVGALDVPPAAGSVAPEAAGESREAGRLD